MQSQRLVTRRSRKLRRRQRLCGKRSCPRLRLMFRGLRQTWPRCCTRRCIAPLWPLWALILVWEMHPWLKFFWCQNNATDETQGVFENTTSFYFDSLYCRYVILLPGLCWTWSTFLNSWDTVSLGRSYLLIYFSLCCRSFEPFIHWWHYTRPLSLLRSLTITSTAGARMAGCRNVEQIISQVGLKEVCTYPHMEFVV